MRHLFIVLLCFCIGFVACKDSSGSGANAGGTDESGSSASGPSFDVKNPGKVSDEKTSVAVHDWVPGILEIDISKVAVNLCMERGKYIYFITMDKTNRDASAVTEVYNAKQEKVCEIGGPQMQNTCPEFSFDGTKDCQAVFLK